MKDLVCVVADRQIAATLEELLLRRRALGIRPVEAEILVHPHHDPGCYARPAASCAATGRPPSTP